MVHLMHSKILYDVTLIVGTTFNQRKIKSHKLLLSIRSDVFEKMFYNATSTIKEEILIPDVNPDIFEIMLKYIYTESLTADSLDDTIQTYYVASRYNIVQLMQMCRAKIESQLCKINVCSVYEMALDLNFQNLKNKCEDIICKYANEALESDSFLRSSYKTVQSIVSMNSLNIKNELFLFDRLVRWAKMAIRKGADGNSVKKLRKFLDPLFPHIRFLSMSHEDIFRGLARSGVFSQDEIMSIGMNIPEPGDVPLPKWCNKNRNARKCHFIETLESENESCIEESDNNSTSSKEINPLTISKILKSDNSPYSILQLHHDCSTGKIRDSKYTDGTFCIECMLNCDQEIILYGFSFYIKYHSICIAELYIAEGSNSCRLIPCIENANEKSSSMLNYNHKMMMSQPLKIKNNNGYYIKVFTDDDVGSCTKSFSTTSNLKAFGINFNIRYINIRNNSHFYELYFTKPFC
ncbi:BTB/POZ domain-containing protein 3-like [Centruroides sculpturatus]|uniref:BTB/POZ domain-containing protein 3-like n=1 Tax=Centruroides sculpturatus TaxID=218467 RepID=UPI000C6CF132|nr:BTB/POZ domain-containing protein 3-like [Centruroides sculpturatus]XP_023219388.1 BTB/POZ domain-containing protein 3-like [Centruroides sculpturatus]XP_023219389.1 BTB/POZ domain-containing protein 3-like [Centruroides sculpturatus]